MKEFMDKDFLLQSETAKVLYHNYAKHMPIYDYHCHLPIKEIYEDRHFDSITDFFLVVELSRILTVHCVQVNFVFTLTSYLGLEQNFCKILGKNR